MTSNPPRELDIGPATHVSTRAPSLPHSTYHDTHVCGVCAPQCGKKAMMAYKKMTAKRKYRYVFMAIDSDTNTVVPTKTGSSRRTTACGV